MKNVLLLILVFFSVNPTNAQDIIGKWKTIDDVSGEPRSVVDIFKKGDGYFGRVLKTFPKPEEDDDPICELCPGDRKNQKIIGMEIITNMVKEGDEYIGGEILDPENGKTYRSKLWIEDEVLYVRGFVAFLFRTQNWYKYADEE
jgi:uncharacterized protein (DUF2147 family)